MTSKLKKHPEWVREALQGVTYWMGPEGISFAKSDALFPPADLAKIISVEYEAQCKLLCYGPYPSWEEIQAKFKGIRDLL